MEQSQQISDDGPLHKYATLLPNTVIRGLRSHGLSIQAKWLYVYLKSVIGETGLCYRSTSTIAKESGMSRTEISRSKKLLAEHGLIVVIAGKNPRRHPDHIRIKDIWLSNFNEFSVPIGNTEEVEKLFDKYGNSIQSVPLGNTEEGQCTIRELSVPLGNSVYPIGTGCSVGGTQEDLLKKIPFEEDLKISPSENSKEFSPGETMAQSPKKSRPTPANSPADSRVWEAYAVEYHHRYGTNPVRNAKVNAQMKQFVQRVPQEEAAHIAAFYVWHNSAYYQTRGHPVGLLLSDAEKLHTEWQTSRPILATQARQQEKTASNPFLPILERLQREAEDDQR